MAKERKQDLVDPEEEALEQRVHDMLDVNAPDEPAPPAEVPTPKVTTPKSISISVTHSDETESKAEESALTEAITETNKELAQEVGTAPLVESPKPSKKAKKVEILHQEEDLSSTQPAEELAVAEAAEAIPEKSEAKATSEIATPAPPNEIDATASVGELMETTSPLEAEIASPETDKAVSEIIANEGDELLSMQPAMPSRTVAPPAKLPKAAKKRPSLLSLIVRSPSFRWTLFMLIVISIVAIATYPKTRYYVLNKAGVRSSASIVITDQSTLRPLKNVKVTLAGHTVTSDQNGRAQLTNLPLGPSQLVVEKRAYSGARRDVTVGWGSNPLPDVSLKAQGVLYSFQVNDIFSNQPITEVEASVGELAASANDKGEIKLALDKIETDEVDVKFVAAGYKDLTYKLQLTNRQPAIVTMTPSRQIAFISKRTGTYDLYKIDVDGKNESLVLKGTGKESSDVALFQPPTGEVVMLLSARDGTYGAEGALKRTLTYVNLKDNSTKTVTSSSQIKAIDWIGTRLVYVTVDDNAANNDPSRYKLMSYDYVSGDNRQLAQTNYFNSVVPMGGRIFYAPASAYQNGINVGVFAVHADGSGKEVILDKESWNMFRTDHDTLTIAVEQEWYNYKQRGSKAEKLAGQPNDTASRMYVDSPDGKHSIWVDNRDGKGTLMLYDATKKTESVLLSEGGITGPVRWLSNAAFIYRVANSGESADYVLPLVGGSPQKITDVTNTSGIDRWSY